MCSLKLNCFPNSHTVLCCVFKVIILVLCSFNSQHNYFKMLSECVNCMPQEAYKKQSYKVKSYLSDLYYQLKQNTPWYV